MGGFFIYITPGEALLGCSSTCEAGAADREAAVVWPTDNRAGATETPEVAVPILGKAADNEYCKSWTDAWAKNRQAASDRAVD
jgi:hypothetical protein